MTLKFFGRVISYATENNMKDSSFSACFDHRHLDDGSGGVHLGPESWIIGSLSWGREG
jgi:hypothetical protein